MNLRPIFYIELGAGGRILRSGSTVGPNLETLCAVLGMNLTEVPGPVEPCGEFYWDGAAGAAVRMPARPSQDHEFDYDALQWILPLSKAWAKVRAERDARLAASDWVRLRADDLGVSVPQAWLDYRQALRDVTQEPDPLAIDWPVPPAGDVDSEGS